MFRSFQGVVLFDAPSGIMYENGYLSLPEVAQTDKANRTFLI